MGTHKTIKIDGVKLYELRQEKGLSLKEAAGGIGVVTSTLHNWESGKKPISRSYLSRVCKFYNVDMDYFEKKEKVIQTLQEVVDALEGDPVIYIGSMSGFFFIGTKEEYEANIEFVQQDLLATKIAYLEKNRRQFEFVKGKIMNPDGVAGTANYWEMLSDRAERMSKLCRYIPLLEDYMDTFVALRKREVIEHYPRLQKDGIVIVVKGKERGLFSDYEEYKKGIALGDLEGEGEF